MLISRAVSNFSPLHHRWSERNNVAGLGGSRTLHAVRHAPASNFFSPPHPTIARSLPAAAAAAKQSASHGEVGVPRQGACWDHGRRRRSSPTLRRKKVNTPFRQDGPAAWLPSGTSRLLLGLSDRGAGSRAAGVAQRGDEDVGSAGDQRHRVHRALLLTLRAVRRHPANSERLGGGNDLANSGAISLSGARGEGIPRGSTVIWLPSSDTIELLLLPLLLLLGMMFIA